jgi:hypothetical protein
MPNHPLATLGFLLVCTAPACVGAPESGRVPADCEPARSEAVDAHILDHLEGEYDLVLVATAGSRIGTTAAGTLRLWRTSSTDRSLRTDARPPPGDTTLYTHYGATDVPLLRVGAPISHERDALEPAPTSQDPVFPGVLLRREGTSATLLVSTVGNRREEDSWLDGTGIMLPITFADVAGFSGTWDHYGLLVDGSGYFCARRRA